MTFPFYLQPGNENTQNQKTHQRKVGGMIFLKGLMKYTKKD